MNKGSPSDEDFLPISELVEQLSTIDGQAGRPEEGVQMTIESVTMEVPIQLSIQTDQKRELTIGGLPPEHYVETTFQPVFHSMKLEIHLEPSADT